VAGAGDGDDVQRVVELAVAAAIEAVAVALSRGAGIGAVPVWRAKLASLGNRSAPAVRPIKSAGTVRGAV
jgi:hypothetical protein